MFYVEDGAAEIMEEEAVGITQFANDQPGFSAVLKHRYADFIVREIPVGAGPVQLTSLAALEQTTQVKTGGGGSCMPCCSALLDFLSDYRKPKQVPTMRRLRRLQKGTPRTSCRRAAHSLLS